MKIRCKNCNKKFDEELNSYICPKCGTYSKSTDTSSGSATSTSSTTKGTEARRSASVKTKVQDVGKKKSLYYPVVIVLLILIIVMPLMVQPLSNKRKEEIKEERYLAEKLSSKPIKQGEWFNLEGNDDKRYTVTIDEARVVDTPEGINNDIYEMIEVAYHIGDENSTEYQDFYSDDLGAEVALTTKSGEILESVPPYILESIYRYTDGEEYDKGISYSLEYKWGCIYYLVKKGDCRGLIITTYERDDDQYSVMGVRNRFVLDELEVTR